MFSALAWLGGSAQQSWHLGSFAHCDATDGSVGAGIGLMTWLWMSAFVVRVGAELLPGFTKRAPTTEAQSKSAAADAALRIIGFAVIFGLMSQDIVKPASQAKARND